MTIPTSTGVTSDPHSNQPPAGEGTNETDPALEGVVRQLLCDTARSLQELRYRAQDLAARFPQHRDVRFLLAELLRAAGEDTQAAAEYRTLLQDTPPNERRRIEQALKPCEPDPAYQTPGFLAYLNSQKFAFPYHRTYLLRDLERGRWVARLLRQRMALCGARVLDVGSSHGGMVMALAEQGARAVGVEIEPGRSQVGRDRLRELGFEVEWHTGDICDPALVRRLGRFEGIICQDVLEHVLDPSLTIRHLCLLLKPGGMIYLAVPNKYSPDFILADHHYQLMGVSLLARPQGVEYFAQATGNPGRHYDTGYLRTEKYYGAAFAHGGVNLEAVEKYHTVEHVLWYAPQFSALAARLGTPALPGLRAELNDRIYRRAKKVVELYVHASRVLKGLENEPEKLAAACQMIVSRLCLGVWRFLGVKSSYPKLAR
jgi:SAM-dependent methyltransferase